MPHVVALNVLLRRACPRVSDTRSDHSRSLDGCSQVKRDPSPGDFAAKTGLNFGVRGLANRKVNGPDADAVNTII